MCEEATTMCHGPYSAKQQNPRVPSTMFVHEKRRTFLHPAQPLRNSTTRKSLAEHSDAELNTLNFDLHNIYSKN